MAGQVLASVTVSLTKLPANGNVGSVSLPSVPIYQLGNPQLRIFRPNWFLTLVRPGKEQPPDTAQFRVPME